jgi:carbon storage regulator
MLVLSRHRDESIIIEVPPSTEPQKIVITVVDVRGDKVRIGCTGNKDVPIHRAEVYEAIMRKHGEMRPGQKQE